MAYSPDLAPCDYWLNDSIKRNLIDEANEKSLVRVVSNCVIIPVFFIAIICL